MRTQLVKSFADSLQFSMYESFNDFGEKSPVLSRILALPVAMIDVAIDTLRCYAATIEHAAVAIINLIGVLFSKEYSLKDALVSVEYALINGAVAPIKSMLATPKIIFQCLAILFSPSQVQSINERQGTFKGESIKIYHVKRPTFDNAYQMQAI